MRGLGCFVCPWVAASSVCCLWPHGCSGRRRARPPARLGDLTSFGAAPRSPARPRHRPRAPQPGPAAVRAACCCLWPHGCSGRRRARPPARLGGLTSFGAAPRSPPVPSGPSGALHTSGARSLMCGALARSPARPRRRPPAPRQVPPAPSNRTVLCNFACNSPDCISDLVTESLIFCGFWA